MPLKIENKSKSTCSKYNFSIYSHKLTMQDLDNHILEILYDENKLNYLFQKSLVLTKKSRITQLQRFVETSVCGACTILNLIIFAMSENILKKKTLNHESKRITNNYLLTSS